MTKDTIITFGISLGITIAGFASTFGIVKNKVDNNTNLIIQEIAERKESDSQLVSIHEKGYTELKNDAKQNAVVIQSINNTLASINTKLDLIYEGKVKIKE